VTGGETWGEASMYKAGRRRQVHTAAANFIGRYLVWRHAPGGIVCDVEGDELELKVGGSIRRVQHPHLVHDHACRHIAAAEVT